MSNLLTYKGYYASVTFDDSADSFHGQVLGIQDVIDFYGRDPDELRTEFAASINDYLAWCDDEGQAPEKTWQGRLTVRMDHETRNRVAVAAAATGTSINAWIVGALNKEADRTIHGVSSDTFDGSGDKVRR